MWYTRNEDLVHIHIYYFIFLWARLFKAIHQLHKGVDIYD